jgi:NADPH:quinone reductase-like Zn-dependent oxidoreductase
MLASTLDPPRQADASAHGVRAVSVFTRTDGSQLGQLGKLLDNGTLRVDVDQTYPLTSAAAAHEALASGAHGKFVLSV